MKSKIFLTLIFLFVVIVELFAQNQKIVAKFITTDVTINGVNVTPIYLSENAYIVFYTDGNDSQTYMANVWSKSKSQSYGIIYSMKTNKKKETYETYETDIFHFNWQYINTYDNKTGTAKVQLIKVYKPQGIIFTIKIIPENLDLLIYKGYMEGSLNF